MLKKTLLYLLFVLIFAFNTNAQDNIIIDNTKYNNWYQCLESGYGKSSFFVGVNKEYPDKDYSKKGYSNNLYYFKIYLFNNSFNYNGFEVPTYLEGVFVYVYTIENGIYVWKNVITVEYALIRPKSNIYDGQYYLGYVYSGDPNQIIKITWNKIRNY